MTCKNLSRWLGSAAIVFSGACLFSAPVVAQSDGARNSTVRARPDFTGLWNNQYTPDYARVLGKQPPFTPYGLERWQNVDTSQDPQGLCLPPGPNRLMTTPFPFMIVQQPEIIAIIFENQTTWRLIYMDGRGHPKEIMEYPEFNGHSIGKWDGDVLVVDTIGIHERTWLDTAGHEHSGQLRLVERFKKLDNDRIEWTAIFEDPVFFTEPWSITRTFTRNTKPDDRLMGYACMENNRDLIHLAPNTPNKER
jgi:hypothetical protein